MSNEEARRKEARSQKVGGRSQEVMEREFSAGL
jgi:hypothetical protein